MKNIDSFKLFENSKIIFSVDDDIAGNYINSSSKLLYYTNTTYSLYIDNTIFKNHYYLIITNDQEEILKLKDIHGIFNQLYVENKISKKSLDDMIEDGFEILEIVKKFINNDEEIIKSFYSRRKSRKFNL
jgi:hypothetical protein